MLTIFQVLLIFIGTLLFYLSNKNQQFLVRPLGRRWRFTSYLSLLLANIVIYVDMNGPAMIFQSIVLSMLGLIIFPFLALFLRKIRPKSL
ncbi:hypothetical protein AT705_02885 [Pseudoalteromonas rubra]|uniref:Uncharacterized protein n=1 Tax=Pseudoalteromonas rubra TaxID=43658 RepID=A0A0U3I2Z2_9GAMM|nr:hypothetical protein AT705_02885 [Pseudoalteromonas rubra]